MNINGIIITGTSCAGKTTLSQMLTKLYPLFVVAKSITTREKRKDDVPNSYTYVREDEFEMLLLSDSLIVSTTYRKKFFGILRSEVDEIFNRGGIPVLLVTPSSVAPLKSNTCGYKFVSFFIDADNDILAERYFLRSGKKCDKNFIIQNIHDRLYINDSDYLVYNESSNLSIRIILDLVSMAFNQTKEYAFV